MAVVIVRHADAGHHGSGSATRPLTELGRRQAQALVDTYRDLDVRRIVSSPHTRCVQTVTPLADRLGLDIERDERLAEGAPLDAVRSAIAPGEGDTVVCSHGDVIGALIQDLRHRGAPLDDQAVWEKAGTWIVEDLTTATPRARYLSPPAPRTPDATPRLGAAPARYSRRVTPQHVGERVSIRHLVDEPDRGPRPTDVVGRLLALDHDLTLIVDRDERLHVVATPNIIASRVVPEHPRLAAEPPVPTRERPLRREAARVLVLDHDERVLLVAHHPAAGEVVWTAPGGGLESDEDHRTAARREITEELGIDAEPRQCVGKRVATFTFRGVWIEQHEQWFLVRIGDYDQRGAPLDDAGITEARWFTLDELRETHRTLAPRRLADLVDHIVNAGVADVPWELGE